MFNKLKIPAICTKWSIELTIKRCVVSAVDMSSEPSMNCWHLNSYSKIFNETTLNLNTKCPKPVIQKPNEMLIEVMSSSVNPIDLAMSSGYGHSLLSVVKMTDNCGIDAITYDRLPLVLGRDFCGQVIACGQSVTPYKAGDIVWGALPPFSRHGSHSQFIVANQSHLSLKPSNLSVEDSAAIPYVGLTAWAAIHTIGGLNETNALNKRSLVLGGSGGVGSFAIQLLKSWGSHVTTTCAADAIDFIYENTGADQCIDYQTNEMIGFLGSFDYVLNAASYGQQTHLSPEWGLKYLRKWKGGKYVTLSSPLLQNTDRFGVILGTGMSTFTAIQQSIKSGIDGQSIRWAFYWPNSCALTRIAKLVENNQIKPIIEKRFKFKDLPLAYMNMSRGHSRGKTLIELT